MKIHTDIQPDDYRAFLKVIQAKALPKSMAYLWSITLALPFGILAGVLLARVDSHTATPTYPAFMTGFVCGVIFLYFLARVINRQQRKRLFPAGNGFILGKHDIELQADGIHVTSQQHTAFFRWSLIGSPAVTDTHAIIPVERIAGIIVPQKSFASEAERAAFVQQIESQKAWKD